MKTYLNLLVTIVFFSNSLIGQIKVIPGGNVGIGTNSPSYKLHVLGGIFANVGSNEVRIIPNNPGAEIGTSWGSFNFWYSTTGWNTCYGSYFVDMSDKRLKKNITQIKNSTEIIKKINGYKYIFNDITKEKNDTEKQAPVPDKYSLGVIAQEIEEVLPELVSESKGFKGVNYDGLIPVLIEAVKEQIQVNEQNQKKIEDLTQTLNACCEKNQSNILPATEKPIVDGTELFQNTPNPFSSETKISYKITKPFGIAAIMIFDLQGTLKRSYPINKNETSVTVKAAELNPGMYLYSLVIDNKEVDTKRMILMN